MLPDTRRILLDVSSRPQCQEAIYALLTKQWILRKTTNTEIMFDPLRVRFTRESETNAPAFLLIQWSSPLERKQANSRCNTMFARVADNWARKTELYIPSSSVTHDCIRERYCLGIKHRHENPWERLRFCDAWLTGSSTPRRKKIAGFSLMQSWYWRGDQNAREFAFVFLRRCSENC